ncbi:F-box protein [Legionella pneumophila]|uniref:FBOX-containing protein n=1 Tax=Legionella pneumophila subsp. pascullei TaxID=91890 RepID=A0AAX2IRL8_LEGPN|nr:F-box protein [Legionella pneumophila]AMP88345.1 type IV secretion protein Dot [Legionella pneumophila subsp. pascullei]AMP91254.1 type IV secretion protein Dot [Legionella pneumophila subsp. pascullei]AMP94241.1 type IV secretion protein Dot [Legionella pneumophila subsp. pascullei]SQG89021.1 FBOX-containing protein [Legionella pneumophila subsp. pascullei]VEH04071.1 FBOX-containing protein [Legionella pneumophila subsp. pascullei]
MKAKYDSTEIGLQNLPPEIKLILLKFLDARSKLALSQTNCGWRDLILHLTDTEEITNTLLRLDKIKHRQEIAQIMSARIAASSLAKLFEELLSISIPSAYVFLIFITKKPVAFIEILAVILMFAALTSLAHDLVDYFIESDTKAEKQYAHRRAFQFFAEPSQNTAQQNSKEEEENLSAYSKDCPM